ncbi:M48 family metalloprotease [Aliikangiella maris]|uniref:M48 family metalloprotease n=2 Tax=Aliikangiella maris TaxID=3162458 RepID=A0ABV3MPJ1_9GAMM
MNADRYGSLIKFLEKQSQTYPAWYKFKVLALSMVGFLFILSMLVLVIGLGIGIFAFALFTKNIVVLKLLAKFFWLPLVIAFYIFKALLVKIEKPQGVELTASELPELFSTIDEIKDRLGTQKIHHVILNDEMNAAVVTIPKLGLLGWRINYLVIGLPLMQLLSPEEFNSVLAHELGHISNRHTRFSNWVYRVRMTWFQLLVSLEKKRSFVTNIFIRFFNWYAPFFDNYTFVLARQNEYEADSDAARVTCGNVAASALIRVHAFGQLVEQDFWQSVWDKAKVTAIPPEDVYFDLNKTINQVKQDDVEQMVAKALEIKTDTQDTHPCLSDRLSALQSKKQLILKQQSASEVYLSSQYSKLVNIFNQQWRELAKEHWQEMYDYYQQARNNLLKFEHKVNSNEIEVDEIVKYAQAVEALHSAENAIVYYRQALKIDRDHPTANYGLGFILLNQNDDSGEKYLRKAMLVNLSMKAELAETLYNYFHYHQNVAKATEYEALYAEVCQQQQAMENKLGEVNRKSVLIELKLDKKLKRKITQQLGEISNIGKVWCAEKITPDYPDTPCIVLVIKLKGFWINEQDKMSEVLNKIQLPCFAYVATTGLHRWLNRKIKQVPNSLLFDSRSSYLP